MNIEILKYLLISIGAISTTYWLLSRKSLNKRVIKEEVSEKIIEYSRKKSCELGKRVSINDDSITFFRPSIIKRKGYTSSMESAIDKMKSKDKLFSKYTRSLITLEELQNLNNFENKSIRAFVDSVDGGEVTLVDNSASVCISLKHSYDIAGEFVIINLNKNEGVIEENCVLKDN